MPIALLINGETRRFDADAISVGRGSENAVSLPNDARLAPLHAILKRVAGRWIVEAQAGGQVSVGSGRPTQFAWIQPGDVIHLTPAGPELVFEPGAGPGDTPGGTLLRRASEGPRPPEGADSAARRASSGAAALAAASMADRRWTMTVVGGGIAVFLLIAMGIVLGSRGAPAGGQSTDPGTTDARGSEAVIGTKPDLASRGTAIPSGDPRNAVYLLELQAVDKTRTLQLGTAWAVGPRQLVTTADVAQGIARNQEYYSIAHASHSLSGKKYDIVGMTLHPQYEAPAGRRDHAQRTIDRLLPEYERAKDPEERRELEKVLMELDETCIRAADEATDFNVALLDVGEDMAGALPWNDGAALRVGQKLALVGYPLSQTDRLADPDRSVLPEKEEGSLRLTLAPDKGAHRHCLVRFDGAVKDKEWSGSPVLDSNGVVVGLYSRVTPPHPGAPIITHDITVLGGLKALMKSR